MPAISLAYAEASRGCKASHHVLCLYERRIMLEGCVVLLLASSCHGLTCNAYVLFCAAWLWRMGGKLEGGTGL